jgi:hypothetical protein
MMCSLVEAHQNFGEMKSLHLQVNKKTKQGTSKEAGCQQSELHIENQA